MGLFNSKKKQRLLEMQNFLFGLNSRKLVKTPNQIITKAASYVNERREKLFKTGNNLNAADNPKKFFDNLDKMEQSIKELEYLDSLSPGIVSGISEIRDTIYRGLPNDIDEMIDRCWETHRLQALKVVKEESKKKKLSAFFELMSIYTKRMYPQNFNHLNQLMAEFNSMFPQNN